MKKFSCFVTALLLVFCVFIFAGCTTKEVSKYYLNSNGELIVEFDNNTTENLGEWNSTIVSSLGSVGISDTGYYVINGVQTNIQVIYESVSISQDGYYVINGIKTNISATSVYSVNFETGCQTNVEIQLVKEGYKVTRPQIEKTG